MRQILGGTRAALHFNASGEAGLTRARVLTATGLAFWVALGSLVTTWATLSRLMRSPSRMLVAAFASRWLVGCRRLPISRDTCASARSRTLVARAKPVVPARKL
jgi:hypothetical protein